MILPVMNVTSFNKQGEPIKTKEVVLDNENVYRIIKKYIQNPIIEEVEPKKDVVKV